MTPLEADAQALADVRTLDEWAAQKGERLYRVEWWEGPPNEFCCDLRDNIRDESGQDANLDGEPRSRNNTKPLNSPGRAVEE